MHLFDFGKKSLAKKSDFTTSELREPRKEWNNFEPLHAERYFVSFYDLSESGIKCREIGFDLNAL